MVSLFKKVGIVILDIVVFLVTSFILISCCIWLLELAGLDAWSGISDESTIERPYFMTLVNFLPQLLAFVFVTFLHNRLFNRPDETSGFKLTGGVSQFVYGWVIALIILAVGFVLLLLLGYLNITGTQFDAYVLFGYLLMFSIQSAGEEVLSRSYMMPAIEQRFNPLTALIVSSLVFAILHATNPSVTILSLLSIFFAGILMGLVFLKYRQIWAPIGLHIGWNFMQGSILGYEVSGFETYSLITTEVEGPTVLTGGSFGFEGSLIAVIGLAIACGLMIYQNPNILKKSPLFEDDSDALDIAEEEVVA